LNSFFSKALVNPCCSLDGISIPTLGTYQLLLKLANLPQPVPVEITVLASKEGTTKEIIVPLVHLPNVNLHSNVEVSVPSDTGCNAPEYPYLVSCRLVRSDPNWNLRVGRGCIKVSHTTGYSKELYVDITNPIAARGDIVFWIDGSSGQLLLYGEASFMEDEDDLTEISNNCFSWHNLM